jgi:hypothetical protein
MTQVFKFEKPRLIQPGSVILKCVDGHWKDRDGLIPPNEMLATGTARGLQCWKNNELLDEIVEQPGEPLPSADSLNDPIPEEEWGLDLNGQPQKPWRMTWAAYLVDPIGATRYTFINSTWGACRAVEALEGKMEIVQGLRGPNIRPRVKLDSRPQTIKSRGITKQRPEFTVLEWVDLTGNGEVLLGRGGARAALQIEHKPGVAEPAPAKKKEKTAVGKPVKPVSVAEEIDDGLPGDLAPPTNPLKAG